MKRPRPRLRQKGVIEIGEKEEGGDGRRWEEGFFWGGEGGLMGRRGGDEWVGWWVVVEGRVHDAHSKSWSRSNQTETRRLRVWKAIQGKAN